MSSNPSYRRGARFRTVACLLAAGGVVAACSSAGSGSSSSVSSAKNAPGTVKAMIIGSTSGSISAEPAVRDGALAAARAVNAAHAAGSHTISVTMCDTAQDPNLAVACARRAVQGKYDAVVGQNDFNSGETLPILESAGIPSIGLESNGVPADWTSKISYPLTAGTPGMYLAIPFGFAQRGITKIALASADYSGAIANADLIESVAAAAKVTVAGSIVKVPLTGVTDYAPYAEQVAKSGAGGVVLIMTQAQSVGLLTAMKSIGLNIPAAGSAAGFTAASLKQIGKIGTSLFITSPYPPVDDSRAPITQYRNGVSSYLGTTLSASPDEFSVNGENAWASVWALAAVVKQMSGTIDAATLTEQLGKSSGVNVAGLLTWSPGKPSPGKFPRFSNLREYFIDVKNGESVVSTSLKPIDLAPYVG